MTTMTTKNRYLNLPTEVIAIGLTIAGAIAGGGVAYGSLQRQQDDQDKKLEEHNKRIEAIEQLPTDIAVIKSSQTKMALDIEEMRKDQRVIMQSVTAPKK